MGQDELAAREPEDRLGSRSRVLRLVPYGSVAISALTSIAGGTREINSARCGRNTFAIRRHLREPRLALAAVDHHHSR